MFRKWSNYFTILKSGYFDAAYYLYHYRDCRLADVDPLMHFVEHGWRENRNPSEKFNTAYYLRTNPDVKQAKLNPLIHYLNHGQYEGRLPNASPAAYSIPRQPKRQTSRGALYSFGKTVYWRLPFKVRQNLLRWGYQNMGALFAGMPHFENWRNNRTFIPLGAQSNLVDLHTTPEAREVTGKIAIHLHIFYPDLVKEFAGYLRNMPFAYDLYVSAANDEAFENCQRQFANLPNCHATDIQRTPNRGRDVAPFVCTFGKTLAGYDYVAHMHTKKSLYNQGATKGWREYLCDSLIGSEERVRRIFGLFQENDEYGIIYPQNYFLLPYSANTWLANRGLAATWITRLGLGEMPHGYFDYPASSMFWARGKALAPLLQGGLTLEDFHEEKGQTDGTLAHTMERLFVISARKQGFSPAILRDEENPSWSAWRFDQYTNRRYEDIVQVLNDPTVHWIAFDIFDTLLSRPLLDPEAIKQIVARRVGGEEGARYLGYRPIAEQQARDAKGKDVGLEEIYTRLGQIAGIAPARLPEIRQIEEAVERASLKPRGEVVSLYKDALATGKPVLILSDMFLSREMLESVLHQHGIEGWRGLFVSSEVGLRKDTGQLYEHVFRHYGFSPAELLMIGDNERVDFQIPTDMGAHVVPLLRPVELVRGLPRFTHLLTAHEHKHDLDADLTLGLVIRKNFQAISYPDFDPYSLVPVTPYHLGYSLIGPLLASFSQWVLETAQADGLERLYFLSREGKPMKAIYDCWTEGLADAPKAEYLVVSRRAAGLAAITSMDDILNIAKTTYYPNQLEGFLHTRYGIYLSDERWRELAQTFKMDHDTLIRVEDRKIDHLMPLLQALEGEIMAQVQLERRALLHYLDTKELTHNDHQAVVDVGYGGSVQKYLNQLISQKVHGYYLMTDERAQKVADTHEVLLRGSFFENVQLSSNMPVMYQYSFDVEKLLSTNEPQIEYYELGASGDLQGHSRSLLPQELAAADIRNQLLLGALDFTKEAREIRETILPDFRPSRWTAQILLEAFLEKKSQNETTLMSAIVLDDYYCGRDLVS